MYAAELEDPFWGKRHTRQYGFGRSSRSDNGGLGRLGGLRCDDEHTAESLSQAWRLCDAKGHVAPRLSLSRQIGKRVIGPGPEYVTAEAFEATGAFARGAQVHVKGREAWAESAKSKAERLRPKTPIAMLSMNPSATEITFPRKPSKVFTPTIPLRLKEVSTLGPGMYDDGRPFEKHMLSTIDRPGRTKMSALHANNPDASPIRRPTIPKNYFNQNPARENYTIARDLGRDAPKVFITSEERGREALGTCDARVGPGSYDIIPALGAASPPSAKAKWLATFTFSKDKACEVPFKHTIKFVSPSKWHQFGDR